MHNKKEVSTRLKTVVRLGIMYFLLMRILVHQALLWIPIILVFFLQECGKFSLILGADKVVALDLESTGVMTVEILGQN